MKNIVSTLHSKKMVIVKMAQKNRKGEDAKLSKNVSIWSSWSVIVLVYDHNSVTQWKCWLKSSLWVWAWWKGHIGTGHLRTCQILWTQIWFSIQLYYKCQACQHVSLTTQGRWVVRGSKPELQNVNIFLSARISLTLSDNLAQRMPVSIVKAPPSFFTQRGSTKAARPPSCPVSCRGTLRGLPWNSSRLVAINVMKKYVLHQEYC